MLLTGAAEQFRRHTFGMAYTKLPIGEEVADSPEDVVRKSRIFGPLSRSWRWMFVCGARGRGNEISIGLFDTIPSVFPFAGAVVAMMILVTMTVEVGKVFWAVEAQASGPDLARL
jgi:hypothetical protein